MTIINLLNRRFGFVALLALIIASAASVAQQPATAPSTGPTARTENAIIADFKQTIPQLHQVMGDLEQLTDQAYRAKVAPQSIPILKHAIDDLEELVRVQPMAKAEAEDAKLDYLVYLSLLGDPSGTERLKKLADSGDLLDSVRAKGAQLMVRWMTTSTDAAAQAKVADEIEQLAKAHPESEDLTGRIMGMSRIGPANDANHDRMEALVTTVMKNPAAESLSQQIAMMNGLKALQGQPLEVKGKLINGSEFSTSQWKGKVVLVDFWATWCGPCLAELPHVVRTYNEHHKAGLEVLGVSNDYSGDELKRFLAESKDIAWPQLFDPASADRQEFHPAAQKLGIQVIPTMLILDKKGIVRSTDGARTMNELVPKLLAE